MPHDYTQHETTLHNASGHTLAYAECSCGWRTEGGGYMACLSRAHRHKFGYDI